MRNGAPKKTITLALALACMAGTITSLAAPAGAAQKPTKFLGALITRDENKNRTIGRDVGISVGLPNKRSLWVFGDTSRYEFKNGNWRLTGFVAGSSAADGPYVQGALPKPLNELWLGHKPSTKYRATVFIPPPRNVYLPNGSGKECSRANGALEEGRWPTGATLMPQNSFVLVSYALVCVPADASIHVEGWGFAIYNWRTNRMTTVVDVFKPAKSGASIPRVKMFQTPVIAGGNVTFFSYNCCAQSSAVYSTTMPATAAAMSKPANYVMKKVNSLPTSYYMSVSGKSPTQPRLQAVRMLDAKGRFAIYTAANPTGPWTKKASGLLPGCRTSPQTCYAVYTHPEMSKSGHIVLSYYVPGYGPGVKGHPHNKPPINHIVMAVVPYAT